MNTITWINSSSFSFENHNYNMAGDGNWNLPMEFITENYPSMGQFFSIDYPLTREDGEICYMRTYFPIELKDEDMDNLPWDDAESVLLDEWGKVVAKIDNF